MLASINEKMIKQTQIGVEEINNNVPFFVHVSMSSIMRHSV